MAASLVHFGVDLACRIPVLQSAGFQVDLCSSIDSLIEILGREPVDAVVISQRPELKVDSVVSVVRSRPSTSVILFAEEPGQPYEPKADLVIPVLTPPQEWLANIAELIAQSKTLRAESQSLQAQAKLLKSETRAAIQRVAKQLERAERHLSNFLEISQRIDRATNGKRPTTNDMSVWSATRKYPIQTPTSNPPQTLIYLSVGICACLRPVAAASEIHLSQQPGLKGRFTCADDSFGAFWRPQAAVLPCRCH